jgi:hypothetical protein
VEELLVSKSVKKVAVVEPRKWELVLAEIRRLQLLGVSVPVIAKQLGVDVGLVKQVVLQSYKMTADTVAVFERQEAGVASQR